MAWSTSQLAELAGTTVKAIRHYHENGLLDEPERRSNNYKQYGVSHLVRLLQIIRLTDLDIPLAQIALMDQGDTVPERALQNLDADLAATIDRLGQVRAELKLILLNQSSTDLPIGFGPVASNLSEADRALILIYSRVLGAAEMQDLFQMLLDMAGHPVHKAFDALTENSATSTRQSIAESYAPFYRTITARYPWMRDLDRRDPRGLTFAADTIGEAVGELYNSAQIDVLRRMNTIVAD